MTKKQYKEYGELDYEKGMKQSEIENLKDVKKILETELPRPIMNFTSLGRTESLFADEEIATFLNEYIDRKIRDLHIDIKAISKKQREL